MEKKLSPIFDVEKTAEPAFLSPAHDRGLCQADGGIQYIGIKLFSFHVLFSIPFSAVFSLLLIGDLDVTIHGLFTVYNFRII